jgi:hypothetical protein
MRPMGNRNRLASIVEYLAPTAEERAANHGWRDLSARAGIPMRIYEASIA